MTDKHKTVGIIGGGSWGTALARLAALAGNPALLWMRDAEQAAAINSSRINKKYWPDFPLDPLIRATNNLKEVADETRFIILVVPSFGFRKVANELGEHLGGDHIIVHATKGIELDTLKRMSEILLEETPARRIGVLSGPNLSEEVMRGFPGGTVVASRFNEVVLRAQDALVSPLFRVYGNRDLIGVEMAGALKNIIALHAGLIDGLGYGHNTMAMLITRGLAEIQRIGVAMGADASTFAGLSGIGDLIATCTSSMSRNHQVGVRLSKGEKLDDILKTLNRVAEGVKTTKAVHELSRQLKIDAPLTAGVHAILFENADVNNLQNTLMTRNAKYETDPLKK